VEPVEEQLSEVCSWTSPDVDLESTGSVCYVPQLSVDVISDVTEFNAASPPQMSFEVVFARFVWHTKPVVRAALDAITGLKILEQVLRDRLSFVHVGELHEVCSTVTCVLASILISCAGFVRIPCHIYATYIVRYGDV
jgi:hypothetical protein